MKNAFAVIMAGGRGERFWPLSTGAWPKQMLCLAGKRSLCAMSVDRLKGLLPPDRIIIITSADLVAAMRKAIPELPRDNIVGEPFGRDTAAAVALASAIVGKRAPDGVFAILTADHVIGDLGVFKATLKAGLEIAASDDVLVTIGIKPASPSTGYGYIEAGRKACTRHGVEFLSAKRFVEKPDLATARKYVASGRYCWNSGMFAWSVKTIQEALSKHAPALFDMAKKMQAVAGTSRFAGTLAKEYSRLEKISIDYAIMEKSKNILMARGAFKWDDVGSWAAVEDHFPKDSDGNVLRGNCEVVESQDNVVMSEGRLTALVGVKGLVVVQSGNATLVCPKDRAQDVKKMVQLLRKKGGYGKVL